MIAPTPTPRAAPEKACQWGLGEAVDWTDRGGRGGLVQPGFFWWGNELEDFCTSFASFGALAPLFFLLAFWGGAFPLIGWERGGWRLCTFFPFLFPFSRPPKRECGESKAGWGIISCPGVLWRLMGGGGGLGFPS